jgi:transposase
LADFSREWTVSGAPKIGEHEYKVTRWKGLSVQHLLKALNTMTQSYLGIDISKDHFDVAILRDAQDERYITAQFDNSQKGFKKLFNWLKKQKARQCPACMEATGRYGEELAEALFEGNHPVSVVNPAAIKSYAGGRMRRNKTDKEDAKIIAHFCATQSPLLWAPPPPHVRELQEMSRRRETLISDLVGERNRLQSGLRSSFVIEMIETNIKSLTQQIATLEQAISQHVDQHPDLKKQVKLLTSIDGIGDITAVSFIAEVPDIHRFKSASQLAAYAGLTPSLNHSGKNNYASGKMCKMGNSRLRSIFYMPNVSARRTNPVIQAFVKRLKENGKMPKTIRGAVMRKLLHLAYGVLKTELPFDPNHHLNTFQNAT